VRPWIPALLLTTACAGEATEPEPECLPGGGGPYWIEEGETVSFTVTCATGAPVDGANLMVAPLPAGATWDAAAGRFTWTPGLDQAQVVDVVITAGAEGTETAAVRIGVADAFDAPGNQPVVDPPSYPLEFGLPVMFISPAPAGTTAAPVTIVYRGETYAAEGEKRGAASLGYPKNSYDLQFGNNRPFTEPEFAGGMTRRRLVLISTFDDNSHVRQRLAYDLWNAIDPDHIQIRTFHVVVYLDGVYHGLYVAADHVDDDLMATHGLDPDGNLFKAINHDANFRTTDYQGNPKATLHQGYEKKEGVPGDFTELDTLVQWAANVGAAAFPGERAARLDTRDYDDWWIFVTLAQADDSAGKNSYHYHDPAGGPWRFAPWDLNHSFGQTWQTEREDADVRNDYIGNNRLFELALADPALRTAIYDRYRTLRAAGAPLSVAAMNARIDAYLAEIDPSARRDQRRWTSEYQSYGGWSWRTDFTTFDEEVAYLRQWLADRWTFLETTY
jgi:hypothetical protein